MKKRTIVLICLVTCLLAIGVGAAYAQISTKHNDSSGRIDVIKDYQYTTLDQLFGNAQAAFCGVITSIEEDVDAFGGRQMNISVTKDWFGGISGNTKVYSLNQDYMLGKEYVFFVNAVDFVYLDAPSLVDIDCETTVLSSGDALQFPERFNLGSISVQEFQNKLPLQLRSAKPVNLTDSKIATKLAPATLAQNADFIIIAKAKNVESYTQYSSYANLEKVTILKGEEHYNENAKYILPKNIQEGQEYMLCMTIQEGVGLVMSARQGSALTSTDAAYQSVMSSIKNQTSATPDVSDLKIASQSSVEQTMVD